MPFDIPDHDVSSHDHQSIWYSTDIDILTAGFNGVGVVDGCAVTAQGSPDMTVAIAAGNVRIASGAVVAVTAGNGTITTADGSNPRIDLVSVSDTGTKTVTAGTAASGPKPPDLPSGHVALAMVYVPASDTTIASNQITDKRVILSPRSSVQAFVGAHAYHSTTQSIPDNTPTAATFDSEFYDSDGFHSGGAPTRLTIPAGMGGKYLLHGYAEFAANATGIRLAWLRRNGTTDIAEGNEMNLQGSSSFGSSLVTVATVDLVAGDYVEMMVYHNRGSALNIGFASASPAQTKLSIVKLDSGKVGSGIGASIKEATAQSISNDTPTALTSNDAEVVDTDGFHDTGSNTSRLTVPAGLGGDYIVVADVLFASDADGYRGVAFYVDGSEVVVDRRPAVNGVATHVNLSSVRHLAAGQYVETNVHHTAGGALDVTMREFSIMRLDSGAHSRQTMPGYEMAYAEATSDVTVNQDVEASAVTVISAGAVTFDGVSPVMIEWASTYVRPNSTAGDRVLVWLFDGSTSLGLIGQYKNTSSADFWVPGTGRRRLTPSAGSHTYSIRATVTAAARTGVVGAGAGGTGTNLPLFIRITRV